MWEKLVYLQQPLLIECQTDRQAEEANQQHNCPYESLGGVTSLCWERIDLNRAIANLLLYKRVPGLSEAIVIWFNFCILYTLLFADRHFATWNIGVMW